MFAASGFFMCSEKWREKIHRQFIATLKAGNKKATL